MFPVPDLPVRSSLCPVLLPMSCKSCVFYLVASPPSVCLIQCIVCVVILLCLSLVWFPGIDIVFRALAYDSLALWLCNVTYLITWILTSACLTMISALSQLNSFTSLCIWVPSFTFNSPIHNRYASKYYVISFHLLKCSLFKCICSDKNGLIPLTFWTLVLCSSFYLNLKSI